MRPYLRAANVTWKGLDLRDVNEMNFPPDQVEQYRLQPGDILLAEASGSASEVGKPALWNGEIDDCCFQNTLIRIRPKTALSKYLLLHFTGDASLGRFSHAARGVGIHHLGAAAMTAWPVALAPLPEQRRIVDEIEKQFARLDAAVAGLKRVQASLKRYRASVLKAACEGRLVSTEAELARREGRALGTADQLTEQTRGAKESLLKGTNDGLVPEGWRFSPLEPLLSEPLVNGRSVPDREGGFPVLRLTCLGAGRVDLSAFKEGAWTRAEATPYLVRDGDFLIARGNGSLRLVGRGGLVDGSDGSVAFPDTLIRVRPDLESVDPRFLCQIWAAPFVRRQIEASARTTAGIYKVNQDHLRGILLPLPPLAEQHRLVAEVDRRLSVIDELESTIDTNLARCARLRQSILKRAFEGKLVPQDPNDEPASALLARLRKERDEEPGRPAKRKPRRAGD